MVKRLARFFRQFRAARAFGLGWVDAFASATRQAGGGHE